jgi:hypothetical protein
MDLVIWGKTVQSCGGFLLVGVPQRPLRKIPPPVAMAWAMLGRRVVRSAVCGDGLPPGGPGGRSRKSLSSITPAFGKALPR